MGFLNKVDKIKLRYLPEVGITKETDTNENRYSIENDEIALKKLESKSRLLTPIVDKIKRVRVLNNSYSIQ